MRFSLMSRFLPLTSPDIPSQLSFLERIACAPSIHCPTGLRELPHEIVFFAILFDSRTPARIHLECDDEE